MIKQRSYFTSLGSELDLHGVTESTQIHRNPNKNLGGIILNVDILRIFSLYVSHVRLNHHEDPDREISGSPIPTTLRYFDVDEQLRWRQAGDNILSYTSTNSTLEVPPARLYRGR